MLKHLVRLNDDSTCYIGYSIKVSKTSQRLYHKSLTRTINFNHPHKQTSQRLWLKTKLIVTLNFILNEYLTTSIILTTNSVKLWYTFIHNGANHVALTCNWMHLMCASLMNATGNSSYSHWTYSGPVSIFLCNKKVDNGNGPYY